MATGPHHERDCGESRRRSQQRMGYLSARDPASSEEQSESCGRNCRGWNLGVQWYTCLLHLAILLDLAQFVVQAFQGPEGKYRQFGPATFDLVPGRHEDQEWNNNMSLLKGECEAAMPSLTHHFLAALDRSRLLRRVFTQNLDGLEELTGIQAAPGIIFGNERCVLLHGSLSRWTCSRQPSHVYPKAAHPHITQGQSCPLCEEDAQSFRGPARQAKAQPGRVIPDIVLNNGPNGRASAITDAFVEARRGPFLLLVIGSSLKHSGISDKVKELSAAAAKTIWVNMARPPTRLEPQFDWICLGKADAWIRRWFLATLQYSREGSDWTTALTSLKSLRHALGDCIERRLMLGGQDTFAKLDKQQRQVRA